uniref:Citrate transporter-like domain-containing protein n=1 Tax=Glossina brevipalpis TaxID=37001 RepID=A0A1A9WQX3_9MUSC
MKKKYDKLVLKEGGKTLDYKQELRSFDMLCNASHMKTTYLKPFPLDFICLANTIRRQNLAYGEQRMHNNLNMKEIGSATSAPTSSVIKRRNNFQESQRRLTGGAPSVSDNEGNAEDETDIEPASRKLRVWMRILRYTRLTILLFCWIVIAYCLIESHEEENVTYMLTVIGGEKTYYKVEPHSYESNLAISMTGPFKMSSFKYGPTSEQFEKTGTPCLGVTLRRTSKSDNTQLNVASIQRYPISNDKMDRTELSTHDVLMENVEMDSDNYEYHIVFSTNFDEPLGLEVHIRTTRFDQSLGTILGIVLLVIIYILLIFDLVHRALAGVIACTLGIGIMGALHIKPDLVTIFSWIHIDTIMLIFGISIIMALMAETGVQDYLAATGFELAYGHIWPMLNVLLVTSFTLAIFYNDIVLILFIAPICIRLSEVMDLSPIPVLTCLIISTNIGSTLTPMGSLSNYLIANSPVLPFGNIDPPTFILHMLPATILTAAQSYVHLRIQFINSDKMRHTHSAEVSLKRQIRLWDKAATTVGDISLDERGYHETVRARVRTLRKRLRRLGKMPEPRSDFKEQLQKLRDHFDVQGKDFIIICCISLTVVLLLFSLYLYTNLIYASVGWIALLAALLALSLINLEGLEGIIARIDWGTMLFISTLCILMNVLKQLALMRSIGSAVGHFVSSFDKEHSLMVAIITVLWLSAFLTCILDNLPVAEFMMHVIVTISGDESLPLTPLIWALALGCSLGGNGTLIGAMSNIACAGVANSHGIPFTFIDYFKVGFLVMIGNLIVASIYLLVVHVALRWH